MSLPWEIIRGDVRQTYKTLPENSFDACLCDPPYGINFMGRRWDYDVPSPMVWAELLRVLKPGAYALIFGGPRTFHRVACAVEDGGFYIVDVLMWMHGQGFPKSHNISKAIDKKLGKKRRVVGKGQSWNRPENTEGVAARMNVSPGEYDITEAGSEEAAASEGYGTQLKPAYEPILLVQKPYEGETIAENVLKWGTGGLAIDACRVGRSSEDASGWSETGSKAGPNRAMSGANTERAPKPDAPARWPSNVILDEEAARLLDDQAGEHKSTPYRANVASGSVLPLTTRTAGGYSDSGGPSRFFYCAKASAAERNEGLPEGIENKHPTVKPIALIEYIAKLIAPASKGKRLIVPYSGSGSEMIGAIKAGWQEVVGIEQEAEYIEWAKARITRGKHFR